MIVSPDSPSIIAISITAIAFTIIGIGIKFAHVGAPDASAVPEAIAPKTTQASAMAAQTSPTIAIYSKEASIAKPDIRDMELWWQYRKMELWWQSTHHQHPQRNSLKRLDTATLAALSSKIAEESVVGELGRREPPRYLSDTSRWPLHGPAKP